MLYLFQEKYIFQSIFLVNEKYSHKAINLFIELFYYDV